MSEIDRFGALKVALILGRNEALLKCGTVQGKNSPICVKIVIPEHR